jgi:hypothetical protein
MQVRATVTRQLALARAQRCSRECPLLDARRVTLAARLDALEAEADDIRRQNSERDRTRSQRDALLADPVTSRLAASFGVTTARVDLLSGMMLAAVLEAVSCLLWTIALQPSALPDAVTVVTNATPASVAPVMNVTAPTVSDAAPSHGGIAGGHAPRDDPVTPLPVAMTPDDELTRLRRDITAGRVRPTVADIRRHLGCAQARASALRRQLADLTA